MNIQELFLSELTELSKKYDLYIDGCGCCDSPRLRDSEPDCPSGEIQWDDKKKEYILD